MIDAASLTFPSDSVIRRTLPNGLTLLLHRDASAPVAAVVTYVKAGYFDETDDVVGIAHVLEHMFFKGTPSRAVGEIAKETKANGGYLNASTIYDHTRYYAVLPSSGFLNGLAIQADAYANSLIEAGELARELEVIIQEVKRKEDTPEAVTAETLFALLHDRHRIRRWRMGREVGLRALRRDHLMAFYKNWYRPSNTIVAIAGDIDLGATFERASALYGPLPNGVPIGTPGPVETALPGRRFTHLTKDITQWHAAFGWRSPGSTHLDTPYLDLAAAVLSSGRASRLYRAVRESRLATSVSAWNYTPSELGVFVAQLSGEQGTLNAALGETWQQLIQLGETLAPHEVERAQRLFEARQLRRLETAEGKANTLADWEALGGLDVAQRYLQTMVEATSVDVQGALGRWIVPQHASLIVLEPDGSPPALQGGATEVFQRIEGDAHPRQAVAELPQRAPAIVVGGGLRRGTAVDDIAVCFTRHNVPILVRRRPGAPMVHVGVHVAGGAAHDPHDLAGMSTVMARAALKGTATRDASTIATACELLGGSIAAAATSDGMSWGFSVPRGACGEAVELLADVVLNPLFPEDAVSVERAQARAQLAQGRDDMYRYPLRLALERGFGDHPYARSALGTDEGLAGVSRDALIKGHRTRILHGDVVIGLVGDVDPLAAAAAVAAAFDVMQHTPLLALSAPQWQPSASPAVEGRDKAQTALCMALPGPSRHQRERHHAHLLSIMASGLGGRFFDELRERRSLAYTVHVGPLVRPAAGVLTAYLATSPEREDEARAGLLREFERLHTEPITADELARAKRYALGTRDIAQQDAGHALNEMLDAWVHGSGLHEIREYAASIHGVTLKEMHAFVSSYCDVTQRVEGVVRGVAR